MNTKNSVRLRILNLAVLYALAFNLIYFIHELGLVVAGAWMENDPVLFHNNMNYLNTSHPSFVLAYAGGPLAVLIVGLLCAGLYYVLRRNESVIKLFVFWSSYHGLWLFFGQLRRSHLPRKVIWREPFHFFSQANRFGSPEHFQGSLV